MQAPAGSNPTPVLAIMLDLQGKINGNSNGTDSAQVVLDAALSAAMLGALSDADWAIKKTVMKDKASILPTPLLPNVKSIGQERSYTRVSVISISATVTFS